MDKNWLLVLTFFVAVIIEIGLPVGLAFLVIRKYKVAWIVVLTGVLTFIASQVVHIPLLQILPLLYKAGKISVLPQQWPIWLYAFYVGILAGLCEETARLIGFKILKNKAKDFTASLALGIGHGGVESVFVGFIVLAGLLSALFYNPQTLIARGVAQDTINAVQVQMQQYWATPWHLPFAGAVERITAISSHLLMSILVWKTVARGKAWGYPAAVLYHTILDGSTVWLGKLGLSAWGLEGLLSIFLVFNVLLIWRFIVKEKASANIDLQNKNDPGESAPVISA